MSDFKDRLKAEYKDLYSKRMKLNNFYRIQSQMIQSLAIVCHY